MTRQAYYETAIGHLIPVKPVARIVSDFGAVSVACVVEETGFGYQRGERIRALPRNVVHKATKQKGMWIMVEQFQISSLPKSNSEGVIWP